jgi:hypothetical protein
MIAIKGRHSEVVGARRATSTSDASEGNGTVRRKPKKSWRRLD